MKHWVEWEPSPGPRFAVADFAEWLDRGVDMLSPDAMVRIVRYGQLPLCHDAEDY